MKGYSVLLFVPAKHEKSGKPDLNRRPQVPQTCTLTNCAIARFYKKDMFDINDELLLCQVHACHHAGQGREMVSPLPKRNRLGKID